MTKLACLFGVLAILSCPAGGAAQGAPLSFANLSDRLRTGETVFVTQSGSQTKGKVIEVRPTSLIVSVNGTPETFASTGVSRVERQRNAVKKGALFGLLAGGGVAVMCGVSSGHCSFGNDSEGIVATAVAGTILSVGGGAGIGAAIGAMMKRRETIYDASAPKGASFSVMPLVTHDRRGAAMSIAY